LPAALRGSKAGKVVGNSFLYPIQNLSGGRGARRAPEPGQDSPGRGKEGGGREASASVTRGLENT